MGRPRLWRRFSLAALGLIALLTLSGCDWTMFGYNAAHTRFTPDTTITGASVSTLQPLLVGPAEGTQFNSAPAVSNGVAYVGNDNGTLYAFDANGVSNCSGTPNQCNPLWTATPGTIDAAGPAVANGSVYVTDNDGLDVYDAHGVTKCSGAPKVCQPLWEGEASPGI